MLDVDQIVETIEIKTIYRLIHTSDEKSMERYREILFKIV